MDARRALPFLLLVICAVSAASIIRNGRGGPNNIRRIRRINLSEYLVPPPVPKFQPPGRVPRLVTPQPTEAPGYFARLMNWLNPFSSSSNTPSPSTHVETSYPPSTRIVLPTSAENYDGPATYDKPPPPPPSSPLHNHPGYASSNKDCKCNTVPWTPIQHDTSFPQSPHQLSSSLNGEYPPRNDLPYDAHHAASQQVRAPDYSFTLPSMTDQDGSFIVNPLPSPHLFAGALPPLFKPEGFNYPVQAIPDSNSEHLVPPPPPSAFGDVSAGNVSFSNTEAELFNGDASVSGPPNSDQGVIHQQLEYINPDVINSGANNEVYFNTQNSVAHGDLSPSGSQVSDGLFNLALDKERFEFISLPTQNSVDSISHQTSFDNSGVPVNQNPPSSYGIFDQVPDNLEHQYNDLSSSANVAKDSHAPLRVTDGSSAKTEDSIHFEKSLLLDFTHKDESRTDSSSIPPTSNAFIDSTNIKISETPLTLDNDILKKSRITTTESYVSTDRFPTNNFLTPSEKSKINSSAQDSSESLHKVLQEQDVSYITPSGQVKHLLNVLSTNSRNTETGEKSVLNSFDDVAEEILNQNVKSNETSTGQSNAKRTKQIQIIIPYTSQYTPFPFHSSHFGDESNHDKYFSEESRNSIKVTSLPNSSYTTSTLLEDIAKKPVDSKVNNSIDGNKLQKNIDNWTIQEYSKGTTVSTELPSSVNPYLFPSKQIPDKYLTTTEPVNRAVASYDDNVKTFTLGGFTFNDLDYKGSASNHVEGPRVQVIQNSESIESSTDASRPSTKDMWYSQNLFSNKERIFVVTPQPIITTPKSNSADKKKEKATKEEDRNSKDLRIDTNKSTKSNMFESIEKAYQVLPQAVNNLAVASTGPERVPLWGIMEHEMFASVNENEHESEDSESLEFPVLYAGHSKVSRANR
ncbi:uncharacterized protein [Anoplolepis gracilipes]|uniref:uncharacterized protein n=1 Tax=Anoplolepis gracilipes TaxID=354296 RepID=UPI003BA0C3C1